ncbi:TPA: hypothetical protein ACPSKV_001629 [Legionella bozemanae]|nr:hypothetical protein [Legionella bozemanae]
MHIPGSRGDFQATNELLNVLECIAEGKPYKPLANYSIGMGSIGALSADPQKTVVALLDNFDEQFINTYFADANKQDPSILQNLPGVNLDKLKANILQLCHEIKSPTVTNTAEKSDIVQESRVIASVLGAQVDFRVKNFQYNNPSHNARQPLDTIQFEFHTPQERDDFYEKIRNVSPSVKKDETATKKDAQGKPIPIVLVDPSAIKSIDTVLFPKLSTAEFIQTTRSLINAGIFTGRSSRLEESMKKICEALETGKLIDGSQINAQVSGGWMASSQQNTASGMISAEQAWTFLFQEMGNLGDSIYKKEFRGRLEKHFNENKIPVTVRRLWSDTFAAQEGYKKDSKYASLENFVSDLPVHRAAVRQTRTEDHQPTVRHPDRTVPHPTVKQPGTMGHKPTSGDTHKEFIQHFIQHHAPGVTRAPLIVKGKDSKAPIIQIEFKDRESRDKFIKEYHIDPKRAGGWEEVGKVYLKVSFAHIAKETEAMENGVLKGKYKHYVQPNEQLTRTVTTEVTSGSIKGEFKSRYTNDRGDYLKSKILKDFYEDLENAETPNDVQKVVDRYKSDGRYAILAQAQNRTMQALGMTTSSAAAFEDLRKERLGDIDKARRAHAA